MKFCSNCGAKLDADAQFCPNCGHKIGQKADQPAAQHDAMQNAKQDVKQAAATLATGATETAKHTLARGKTWLAAHKQTRPKAGRWLIGAVVAILAIFFAYRLAYLPHVVRNAVDANVLNQGGYTAKANTLTKTVTISTDDLKLERLMDAIKANDYDTTHIGAEEQLAALEKALPGNWKVQITQDKFKGSQTVLWRYQGSKETIRYQTSEECKLAHKTVMAAKAKNQSQSDAVTSGVTAGLIGGVLGAVLAR